MTTSINLFSNLSQILIIFLIIFYFVIKYTLKFYFILFPKSRWHFLYLRNKEIINLIQLNVIIDF